MEINKGYQTKRFNVPTKRYCQTLSLKDNPELIAAYRRLTAGKGPGRRFGKESVR